MISNYSRRRFFKNSMALAFTPGLLVPGAYGIQSSARSGSSGIPVKIRNLDVSIIQNEPNPNPIRDALKELPGIGRVIVKATSEDGITGEGSVSFGRIFGSLKALKSFIDNILKPLVLGSEPGFMGRTYEAIRRGRIFEDLGCYWYEEPIPAPDIEGYKQSSNELKIQLATGENLTRPQDFAHFIKHDAAHFCVMACLPNTLIVESGRRYELKDGKKEVSRGWKFSWE